MLVNDIELLRNERYYYSIDYKLFRKGDREEIRFVLGKVIMDIMRGRIIYNRINFVIEKKDDFCVFKSKVE